MNLVDTVALLIFLWFVLVVGIDRYLAVGWFIVAVSLLYVRHRRAKHLKPVD